MVSISHILWMVIRNNPGSLKKSLKLKGSTSVILFYYAGTKRMIFN